MESNTILRNSSQKKIPISPKLSQEEKIPVQKKIHEILKNEAIVEIPNYLKGDFISNLFLVEKGGGNWPVINLKHLNQSAVYQHFKIEGFHYLQNILKKGDYMCELDLKYAHFSVPLNLISRKFVRFLWSGKLYEFLCLCIWLGPTPRIFTKLLKIPVFTVASTEHINYNLFGHVVDGPYNPKNVNGQEHCNFPSSTSRVCTEFQKISLDTYTENRALRSDSKFISRNLVFIGEESVENSEVVSRASSENTCADFIIYKTNKLVAINYLNSTSSTNIFQAPTRITNTSIKNAGVILQKRDSKQKLQRKTAVVDTKFENLQ